MNVRKTVYIVLIVILVISLIYNLVFDFDVWATIMHLGALIGVIVLPKLK